MNTPEAVIVAINILITGVAYFLVYPKLVGDSLSKLTTYDFAASLISLAIAGMLYWGSGVRFSIFVTDINWFWFAFLTYSVLETPLMLGYMKTRNMSFSSLD